MVYVYIHHSLLLVTITNNKTKQSRVVPFFFFSPDTYTNSLIVNGVIVIPGYTQGNDTKAVLDYQKASPNRSIVVVNTDTLIPYGGSVHSVTIQLPRASNSPNQHDFVIPNISCAELNGAPSCSIQNTSELCQRNYKTFDLGYAPTEGECRTKNRVLERTCCKPASKNSTGLVVLKDESPLFPVKLKFFLDDSPAETSWIIVNTTNAVVASSPLYGSDMACQSVKMDLSLPVGMYEIIVMDSEGNGIAAPCCSAVLTLTDFQVLYHDFGLYTSATFVVDEEDA
jgi:Porphyromonas-type peptidyl-arginine deiminase